MPAKADRNYEILVEMRNHTAGMEKIMDKLHDNIKAVNDSNLLHHTKIVDTQKDIREKVLMLTNRYWWMIIFLIVAMMIVLGYEEILKILPFM